MALPRSIRGVWRAIVLALAVQALALVLTLPGLPKGQAYALMREAAGKQLDWSTRGWSELQGGPFTVRYRDIDRQQAQLVLNTARQELPGVLRLLNEAPPREILIVIYPDHQSLNKSFGWPADESAMGVYWAGSIRVLAPDQWIKSASEERLRQTFESEGPMAHELAHLVLDYRTKGNYPRWFTEGVAQYVERELTGFCFAPPRIPYKWYDLAQMDADFDNLSNQSLAYYQSLRLVEIILQHTEGKSLDRVLSALETGLPFPRAINLLTGMEPEELARLLESPVQSVLEAS